MSVATFARVTTTLDSSELPGSALAGLNASIEQTVTSLYALQTAFINASNATDRQQPYSRSSASKDPSPFDSVRLSFHGLLKDVASSLRQGYTWMDNPLMLCQLSSFSSNSPNSSGLGQLLSEAHTQAGQMQRALATVAQRCEAFIFCEFEQLALSLGLQSLFSGPTKAKVHSNLFRKSSSNKMNLSDVGNNAFVLANISVLYPHGMAALDESRASLIAMHRTLLELHNFWSFISQICHSLLQNHNFPVPEGFGTYTTITSDELERLRASMYLPATWLQQKKQLFCSMSMVEKMSTMLLIVPTGAPLRQPGHLSDAQVRNSSGLSKEQRSVPGYWSAFVGRVRSSR